MQHKSYSKPLPVQGIGHGRTDRCKRCGGPTEAIVGQFFLCQVCDSPYALPKVAPVDESLWIDADDEDTNPGVPWASGKGNFTITRQYTCGVKHVGFYPVDAVANGQLCGVCNRSLHLLVP